MIQVGTGGMGRTWCTTFLPGLVADGLVEVVAAVDVVPAMLENARTGLGLPPERLYTEYPRGVPQPRRGDGFLHGRRAARLP